MILVAFLLLSCDVVLSQANSDIDMCLWDSTDHNGLYRNTGKSYNNKTYYILTKCNQTTYLAYFDYSYIFDGQHFDNSYVLDGQNYFRWGISSTLSAPYFVSGFCDVNGLTPDIACGETGHFVRSSFGDIDPNAYITSNSKPNHIACVSPKVNCSSIHVIDTGASQCSGTFIQSHQLQDGYLRFKRQSTAEGPYSDFQWTFNVNDWKWSCTSYVLKYPSGSHIGPCTYSYIDFEHWMNLGFEAIFSSQGLNYTGHYPDTDVHNVRFTCIELEEHGSKGFTVIIIVTAVVIIVIAVCVAYIDRQRKIKQQSRALDKISRNDKSETQAKHELLMDPKNNNSALFQIVNVDSINS